MPTPAMRAFSVQISNVAAWTPASLTGLRSWYDASNAASITSSGGAVSQWNDLSGNGYHLVQGTGANQPITGTTTINGLNVIVFSDDYMDAAIGDIAQPTTVYFAGHLTAAKSGVFDSTDSGGTKRNHVYVEETSTRWRMYAGTDVDSGDNAANVDYQGVAVFNGASSALYINGVSIAASDVGSMNLSGFRLGWNCVLTGAYSYHGSFGEVAIQDAAASGTDLTNWNTYCARWGL